MRAKSRTLWEVFVPQHYSQVSFRRTERAMVMQITDRSTGKARANHFKRPGARLSPRVAVEDFRGAMEMHGSRPEFR